MATTQQLQDLVTCLATAYPTFVSSELTKLAVQAQGIAQAATDPLGALASQNVNSLTATATGLAGGDVISTVAATGLGVLYNEVISQQLQAALQAVYTKYPAAKSFVEFAENSSESAIGLIHLFLSLNVEAPYAIAQIVLEGALPVIAQKQRILNCMIEHTAQISNTMMALAVSPQQANLLVQTTLAKIQKELTAAQIDFRTCIANLQQATLAAQGLAPQQINYGTTGGFLVARFNSGQAHLQNADILLSPALPPGNNVISHVVPILENAIGGEFLTEANRQMSLVLLGSLVGMMQSMMEALVNVTTLVNLYISAAQGLTSQLTSLQTNAKLNALRLKLLQGIDTQLASLISQVSTKPPPTASAYSLLAIAWSSEIRVLLTQAQKVVNANLSTAGVSAGDQQVIALQTQLNKILAKLNAINIPPSIIHAVDDLTVLQGQMKTFLASANNLLDQVSSSGNDIQQAQISRSLSNLMKQVAPLGIAVQGRLNQSVQLCIELVPIINEYLAVNIPIKSQIQQILLILDKAGMGRASDLLRAGDLTNFMQVSYMTSTYAGFAATCLMSDIANAPDQQTAQDLQDLLDDANSALLTSAVMSSDILNGGQSSFYSALQSQIAQVNANAATAEAIIARMTALAKQVGVAITSGAAAATLSQAINSAGSELDSALRAVTTAGLGFPGCD